MAIVTTNQDMRNDCNLELVEFVRKRGSLSLASHLAFSKCLADADAQCRVLGVPLDSKRCVLHFALVVAVLIFVLQEA
jgi:hypothetical protein